MMPKEFRGIQADSKIDALCIAVANSMFDEMEGLLTDGADINGIAGYTRSTPLTTAAGYGLIRSVEFLLERGADIDLPGENDMTPLMHACSLGKVKGTRVALRLLESKPDVIISRSDEMTALKFAVRHCGPELIQSLIDHGADVDGPAGTTQTALMLAARANNVDAIQVLVRNGADTTRPCGLPWAKGTNAEGLAVMEKRKKAVAFFASLRGV